MKRITVPIFGTKEFYDLHKHLQSKQILNTQEASFYLGIRISYLYILIQKKKIESFSPNGGKRYFEKETLNDWMTTNKSKSIASITKQATNYLLTSKTN